MISYHFKCEDPNKEVLHSKMLWDKYITWKGIKSGESTLKPSIHKGVTYGKFEELMDD